MINFTKLAVQFLHSSAVLTIRWCGPQHIFSVGQTLIEANMDSPLFPINVKAIFIMSDQKVKETSRS